MLKGGFDILLPIIEKNKDLKNYWISLLSRPENANIHIAIAPEGALSPSLTSLRIRQPNSGEVFIFFQYEFFKQLLTAYPINQYENKGIYFAERLISELGMPDFGHYSNEDADAIMKVIQNDALLLKFARKVEITREIGAGDTTEDQTISYGQIMEDFFSSDINYTGDSWGGGIRKEDYGHWFRSGFYYKGLLRQQVEGVNNPEVLKSRVAQYLGSFVQTFNESTGSSSVGGIDMNEINVKRQGAGVDIQFDPVMMQDILNNGVEGFVPVIINLTPISSIFLLLGIKEREEEKGSELSLLKQ